MTTRMMNLVVKAIEAAGIKAEIVSVAKNNETLQGVSLGEGAVRPTLYFKDFEGKTSKDIARAIIEKYESLPKAPEIDVNEIMNRDYIRQNVKMKLVPYSDYVKGKAARSFLNLFKLFYIPTPIEGGYITLTIDHISRLGIEVAELEAWANANSEYEVKGMYDTLMEMNPDMASLIPAPEHEEQLVISTKNKFQGASAMTSTEVLEQACDKLGADLIYILPSSIHEVLAIALGNPEELRNMVCEDNDTQVEPKERLSYEVYRYKRGGQLEIA